MILAYLSENKWAVASCSQGETKEVERVPRFGSADFRKKKGSSEKVPLENIRLWKFEDPSKGTY
jgi:hypothetical protein